MKKLLCILLVIVFLLSMYSICVSAREYTEEELINMSDASELLNETPEDGDDSNNILDDTDTDGYNLGTIEITPNSIIYCIEKEEINAGILKETYVMVNGTKYSGTIVDDDSNYYDIIEDGVIAEAKYNAKVGDTVYIYFVLNDNSVIKAYDVIVDGNDELTIDEEECDTQHTIFYYLSDTDKIKDVKVTVAGKAVSCSEYTGAKTDDYDIDSYDYAKAYQAKYNAEINDEICVTVTTEKGFTYIAKENAKAFKPTVSVNDFYSGETIIKGKTNAILSDVLIKAGTKSFKTKSDKNGNFNKKITTVKTKTKITVTVTTGNLSASKTITAKNPKGTIKSISYITTKSKKIQIRVSNNNSGDKIKVTIANKKYIVKANKSKVSVKIKAPKRGLTVTIVYYDKFGYIKSKKTKIVK